MQTAGRCLPFTRPTIDEETIAAVAEVLRSGWLASGTEGGAARGGAVGVPGRPPGAHADLAPPPGLEMALLACGIGPGDEVITPALSFVATANVIVRVGARPVFVDVGLDSRNIDLDQVEAAITPRTRAIMPVHFAGLPVDMERLYAIAGAPPAARHRGCRACDRLLVARAGASAASATWCASASTPTRTSPPSRAARSPAARRRR